MFDAVRQSLSAGLPAEAPALLAGNLPLRGSAPLDAVLVRPHSLTLLLFQPGAGGQLRIPAFISQPWLLDGRPVTTADHAVNPYQTFQAQCGAALQLLGPLLPPEAVNPHFVTGLWMAGGPLRFDADVEASMAAAPEARQLQLLPDVARLPRRVAQLATPEIELTAADIRQLAEALPAALPHPAPSSGLADDEAPASLGSVVQNTARQLWRWLGADDLDELPPDTYELAARGEDRKHALEAEQAALQQQLAEQIQAIEARESAREQSMAQLRTELAQAQQQAAPNAADLQARLAAESRAKAAEDASLRAAQQEWQRRNQDLDAKINTLEQLIQRLQGAADLPPAVSPHASAPRHAAAPPAAPSTSTTEPPPPAQPLSARLQQWWRQVQLANWPRGRERWRRALPATDHWGWLALGGVLALGAMLWLSTQVFQERPPEPYEADGRWGFARDGEPVVKAQYTSVQPFQNARAVVERDGAFGFVDDAGQEVVPPAYDALNPYAEGYARVRIGDLYTFIDEAGQEFSHYFYNAYDFAEGYAAVLDRRGWFYISGPDAGVPARPRLFQEAYPFRNGLARVRKNDAYTFITPDYLTDTTRTDTEPFGRYEQATDFADGQARVRQNGRSFYIGTDGQPVD
ncbi:hypothetical protein GCM10027048_34610 [Hymenobacter coalescens]